MTDPKTYKFNTKTLHSGHQPDKNFGSRAVPIYQTTSYLFQDADHAAALFNLEEGGHIYSRISNPTISVLEERVAALEGGSAALATASGMSAMMLALLNICSAGDHIVSSSQLYGGSFNLLRLTLKRFGIETTFVKPRDTEGFKKAIQPNTKCIWGELIGNPGIEIMDLPEISKIANDAGIPLMVDGTFNTPYLCNLFELGADINLNSYKHLAIYNKQKKRIEMRLKSKKKNKIRINGSNYLIKNNEEIHTENSHKYTIKSFKNLANKAGWKLDKTWVDDRKLFSVHFLN